MLGIVSVWTAAIIFIPIMPVFFFVILVFFIIIFSFLSTRQGVHWLMVKLRGLDKRRHGCQSESCALFWTRASRGNNGVAASCTLHAGIWRTASSACAELSSLEASDSVADTQGICHGRHHTQQHCYSAVRTTIHCAMQHVKVATAHRVALVPRRKRNLPVFGFC